MCELASDSTLSAALRFSYFSRIPSPPSSPLSPSDPRFLFVFSRSRFLPLPRAFIHARKARKSRERAETSANWRTVVLVAERENITRHSRCFVPRVWVRSPPRSVLRRVAHQPRRTRADYGRLTQLRGARDCDRSGVRAGSNRRTRSYRSL